MYIFFSLINVSTGITYGGEIWCDSVSTTSIVFDLLSSIVGKQVYLSDLENVCLKMVQIIKITTGEIVKEKRCVI